MSNNFTENQEIFYHACKYGNEDRVSAWLDEEYGDEESEKYEANDLDLHYALKLAKIWKRTSATIQYYIDRPRLVEEGSLEFIKACDDGDLDKVNKLIGTAHVDVSFNDAAALKAASANGHEEIVEIVEDYM